MITLAFNELVEYTSIFGFDYNEGYLYFLEINLTEYVLPFFNKERKLLSLLKFA